MRELITTVVNGAVFVALLSLALLWLWDGLAWVGRKLYALIKYGSTSHL